MKLNIQGWSELKKYFPNTDFSKSKLNSILCSVFPDLKEVSVIFVSEQYIQSLNEQFRKKQEPTDVLSFVLVEQPLAGEIYVCPEYIIKEYQVEEVLRVVVHGFLHLLGYDHKGKFEENLKKKEEMFVKQEDILQNILYEINNGTRQSR